MSRRGLERHGGSMNDKIGELMARYRYWSERAALYTDLDAVRRCADRAERLQHAIREELGYALGRMDEAQLQLPLPLCPRPERVYSECASAAVSPCDTSGIVTPAITAHL